jgi:hypothetical protein
VPVAVDDVIPRNPQTTAESQTETAENSAAESTRDTPTAASSNKQTPKPNQNIPRYNNTTRETNKPGPASSKPRSGSSGGRGSRPPKWSTNPISLHNRYGSLDDMEVDLQVKRTSPHRLKHKTQNG